MAGKYQQRKRINVLELWKQGCSGAVVEHLAHYLKVGGSIPVLNYFSVTPPENSGGAEKSTENSGLMAKTFFALCTK
jgi:hypothetical protein